jgi:hypothetical protein
MEVDRVTELVSRASDNSAAFRVIAVGLILLLVVVAALAAPIAVRAQSDRGPQLIQFPIRWCVLEGSRAARTDPDGAVLERVRRGSSILAREMGITLRSALNQTLAAARAFPVIKDPRTNVGRPGDVLSPVVSTAEYTLVMQRCLNAWQRLQRAAAPGSDFGGVAYGPPAVIIRDFVTSTGSVDRGIWGYAFSASTNADYCNANTIPVRRASGGSMMIVDSSDGTPSLELDRRLVAHETGHMLRLGHGNGRDDPGTTPARIDKFCDAGENPYIEPGSLMTHTLRYDSVLPWQRRLPRNVLRRHPAAVQEQVVYAPRVARKRFDFLQRLAHDGSRTVRRLLPPSASPLRPLPSLSSAGVRGTDLFDAIRETPGGESLPRGADLRSVGISQDVLGDAAGEDIEPGEAEPGVDPGVDPGGIFAPGGFVAPGFDISIVPDGLPFSGGTQVGVVVIDLDGDEKTGGSPGPIPGRLAPGWQNLAGIDLLARSRLVDGELSAEAWRWDPTSEAWLLLDPPPSIEVTQRVTVTDRVFEEEPEDDTRARRDSVVISIPPGQVELSERFNLAAMLELRGQNGRVHRDMSPADPVKTGLAPLSFEPAEYPVCAVNRQRAIPGAVAPGEQVTLELSGFGSSGPASVRLGERPQPIGIVHYNELGCAWPAIAQVTLPEDLEPGVQVMQIQLGDTGLTAECGVLVGDGDPPDFDQP